MSKLNFNTETKKTVKPVSKPTRNALTENGALAYNSLGSPVLDMLATFGAMRERSESDILNVFYAAFNAFPLQATQLLVFFRDCRGGKGERRSFDVVFKDLIRKNHVLAYELTQYVPYVGYWKEIRDFGVYAQSIGNSRYVDFICALYAGQIANDMVAKNMSLAAKYAPNENWAEKPVQKQFFSRYMRFATELIDGVTDRKSYRKLISMMRAALEITERQMSLNQWDDIVFASVPSKAHSIYRKAFGKHQQERYASYLKALEKGETKINASVLTPVDVMHKYLESYGRIDTTLEEQWKALPNYVNDDVLAVCDVSGSMSGRPMEISVALGIYLAQRAKGICKNELVTFSGNPSFFDISKCKNLRQAIDAVQSMDWGMNTDLVKTFDLLLKSAKSKNATDADMPKYILIISDMQWDSATNGRSTPFEEIKGKFAAVGLTMPKIVFWQVRASSAKAFPTFDEFNVMGVSGESPAVLAYVLGVLNNNSTQVLDDILNNPRYAFVDSLECWGLE